MARGAGASSAAVPLLLLLVRACVVCPGVVDGTSVRVLPDLACSENGAVGCGACDTQVSGARVSIVEGLDASSDELVLPTMDTDVVWSAAYNADAGYLVLLGTANMSDYAALLRGVTFDTASQSTVLRVVCAEVLLDGGDPCTDAAACATVNPNATTGFTRPPLTTPAAPPPASAGGGGGDSAGNASSGNATTTTSAAPAPHALLRSVYMPTAVASVVTGGGGGFLRVLMAAQRCGVHGAAVYPGVFRPLDLHVLASDPAGAVMGGALCVVGVYVIATVLAALVRSASACLLLPTSAQRGLAAVRDAGVLASPSAPFLAYQFVQPAAAAAAVHLLGHPASVGLFAVGQCGVLLVVVPPLWILRTLHRSLRKSAEYVPSREAMDNRLACIVGTGEWISRTEDNWARAWHAVIWPFREPRAWVVVADAIATGVVTAVAAAAPGPGGMGCVRAHAVIACVLAAYAVFILVTRPYNIVRNTPMEILTMLFACAASIVYAVNSRPTSTQGSSVVGAGDDLVTAAWVCVVLRTLLDGTAVMWSVCSGRQGRLQDAAFDTADRSAYSSIRVENTVSAGKLQLHHNPLSPRDDTLSLVSADSGACLHKLERGGTPPPGGDVTGTFVESPSFGNANPWHTSPAQHGLPRSDTEGINLSTSPRRIPTTRSHILASPTAGGPFEQALLARQADRKIRSAGNGLVRLAQDTSTDTSISQTPGAPYSQSQQLVSSQPLRTPRAVVGLVNNSSVTPPEVARGGASPEGARPRTTRLQSVGGPRKRKSVIPIDTSGLQQCETHEMPDDAVANATGTSTVDVQAALAAFTFGEPSPDGRDSDGHANDDADEDDKAEEPPTARQRLVSAPWKRAMLSPSRAGLGARAPRAGSSEDPLSDGTGSSASPERRSTRSPLIDGGEGASSRPTEVISMESMAGLLRSEEQRCLGTPAVPPAAQMRAPSVLQGRVGTPLVPKAKSAMLAPRFTDDAGVSGSPTHRSSECTTPRGRNLPHLSSLVDPKFLGSDRTLGPRVQSVLEAHSAVTARTPTRPLVSTGLTDPSSPRGSARGSPQALLPMVGGCPL